MAKAVPQRTVLKKVPSGEIALEIGGDGTWLRFDCDCLDALPYCKAACCGLHGIRVDEHELEKSVTVKHESGVVKTTLQQLTVIDDDEHVMIRGSDGLCTCLSRQTRLCGLYKDRPDTCQSFHCSRGPAARGWRLSFDRQLSHE